MQVKAEKENVC